MPKFVFEIDAGVRLRLSHEQGVVIGRAEYKSEENQYYVLYVTADGRQVRDWWNASQLESYGNGVPFVRK